ncbi:MULTISPECIES: PEP-CTERM/exosortase system-associated acyltransferase [Halomonas]|uniref:N-acyl amino acid synthase of PEP-CTERM/exosortase system n=1 Tax=Halomonas ventosae TaxID=229007 RepID=A0A4R6H344_9GAMM|nr:PEP-CTERM/exosortase system-associated acyltransferase [Halomonas ventosae]TDO02510.1 N-acyl amino acid synthase of PEP-CTERM/exosortase system [Halomonas ventosae]
MPHSNWYKHRSNAVTAQSSVNLAVPFDKANLELQDELIKKFMREFTFKLASTPEDIEKSLALRHEVFVQELGYKMQEKDNNLESDEYDSSSYHCILTHKRTDKTAGCFRIVTTQNPNGEGYRKLPVEEHGNEGISHLTLHPNMLPREYICEASRLAISKEFRVSQNSFNYKKSCQELPPLPESVKEVSPLILISIFLAAYSLAEIMGNRHMYAMMAPTLPRLLRKSGFEFIRLGETFEFHGKRNVFYINRSLAISGVQHALYPLHQCIYQEIKNQVDEHSSIIKASYSPS